jgi:hypothetical protein
VGSPLLTVEESSLIRGPDYADLNPAEPLAANDFGLESA